MILAVLVIKKSAAAQAGLSATIDAVVSGIITMLAVTLMLNSIALLRRDANQ